MKLKRVKWLGENGRVIPNYGVTEKGAEKELPLDMADNFIKQNLAEDVKTKAVKEKGDK